MNISDWAFSSHAFEFICFFQIEPFKTGAVAPEVNKLKVGKLDIKEEEKSENEVTPWMKMADIG